MLLCVSLLPAQNPTSSGSTNPEVAGTSELSQPEPQIIPSIIRIVATDPVGIERFPENGGIDAAEFEISRSGENQSELRVNFALSGSATPDADYEAIPNPVVLPVGQSSVKISVIPRIDLLAIVEPVESVSIRILSVESDALRPLPAIDPLAAEAFALIFESRLPTGPVLEFASPAPGSTIASGSPLHFTALLVSPHPAASVVLLESSLPVANAPPTGSAHGVQWFQGTWQNPSLGALSLQVRAVLAGITLTSPIRVVTVDDAEILPVVSIRQAPPGTKPVPDADHALGSFVLSRTGTTDSDLAVFYQTGGTAQSGADYRALPMPLVIPAGQSTLHIPIEAIDDNSDEPDETVRLSLIPGNPLPHAPVPPLPSYSIDPAQASATMVIRDADPAVVSGVSIHGIRQNFSEPSSNTDSAPGIVEIRRTGSTAAALDVGLNFAGTASGGVDYKLPPAGITIPSGQSGVRLLIPAIHDELEEGEETVIVSLLRSVPGKPPYEINPVHYASTLLLQDYDFVPGPALVRIVTTDPRGTQFPSHVDAHDPVSFRISRSGSLVDPMVVWISLHGTAQPGFDYEAPPHPVTIPAGIASMDLVIHPLPWNDGSLHRYEVISAPGITWEQAKQQAEDAGGYLATITSTREDEQLEELRLAAGGQAFWVGGYQEAGEHSITGGWKWLNGEGNIPGFNGAPGYANWLPGEPNDYWGPASENHMVIGWLNTFGWNDQINHIGAAGYIVETEVGAELQAAGLKTLTIQLQPSPAANPLPSYGIDPDAPRAAAILLPPVAQNSGHIEAAFPEAGSTFRQSETIPFLVALYHPTEAFDLVEFFLDGQKIGIVEDANVPSASEGVSFLSFPWIANRTGSLHFQVKGTNAGGASWQSSRLPLTILPMQSNQPPVATLKRPVHGQVFTNGSPIEVLAHATDPDGSVVRLELLRGEEILTSVQTATLQWTIPFLSAGIHHLRVRAWDNTGAAGLSPVVQTLVRPRNTLPFVQRILPSSFLPGEVIAVQLQVHPPAGTAAFALEDLPPAGWTVSTISHQGKLDPGTGKVKFGPYTQSSPLTLSYQVRAPSTASGTYRFSGTSALDGLLLIIGGNSEITAGGHWHPADANHDMTLTLAEVTAYAAAWKQGASWPEGPVPVPLAFATQAGTLWKSGEAYRFDSTRPSPPDCWIPSGPGVILPAASLSTPAASLSRTFSGILQGGSSILVQLSVSPESGTGCHGIEETPPMGWNISEISHDGARDGATGTLRWGVYYDDHPRVVSYKLTPPPGVVGMATFTSGFSSDRSSGETHAAAFMVGAVSPAITRCVPGPGGTLLQLTGPPLQTMVLESSEDLVQWEALQSLFLPGSSLEFTDTTSSSSRSRFYRLILR